MINSLTLQVDSILLSALQQGIPVPENVDPHTFLSSLATDRLLLYYGLVSPLGNSRVRSIKDLIAVVIAEYSAFVAAAPRRIPFTVPERLTFFRNIPTISEYNEIV